MDFNLSESGTVIIFCEKKITITVDSRYLNFTYLE